MEMAIKILSHPLFGSALGVLGIILGFYFYFLSRKFSRLSLQKQEVSIIGMHRSAPADGLEIRYKGKAVPRVTKVTAFFWNSGTDTIEGSQIATTDPLRINISEDSHLLNIEIIKQSRIVNNVHLEAKNDHNGIYFDFLDKNDGFVLEILHSGGKGDLIFSGTIKGIPKGITLVESGDYFENTFTKKALEHTISQATYIFPWASLFLGLFLASYGTYSMYNPNSLTNFTNDTISLNVIFIILGVPYILFSIFAFWFSRRRFPAHLDLRPNGKKER